MIFFINKNLNKKFFQKILKKIWINFTLTENLIFIDKLKLLSSLFLTYSGFSLTLENFNVIPNKFFIQSEKKNNINKFNINWENYLNELKNHILLFFNNKHIYNNLYIFSNSGARGSIEQVYQMIALRGLLSDQSGNQIKKPILSSFREGLSLFDFLNSASGSRKGIIDTALNTATSGYLTRKLVEIAYNIFIKDKKCSTYKYFIYKFKNNFNSNNFKVINFAKINKNENFLFILRTVLSCKNLSNICQECYGTFKLDEKINIGENIGIIAAQYLGEPGTQMTMRTFHTGGLFISKLKYYNSISGFVKNYKSLTWKNNLILDFTFSNNNKRFLLQYTTINTKNTNQMYYISKFFSNNNIFNKYFINYFDQNLILYNMLYDFVIKICLFFYDSHKTYYRSTNNNVSYYLSNQINRRYTK